MAKSATTAKPPSISDIQRAAVERTIYGYAEEYIFLESSEKFTFTNHNYLIGIYLDPHPYVVIEKSAQLLSVSVPSGRRMTLRPAPAVSGGDGAKQPPCPAPDVPW